MAEENEVRLTSVTDKDLDAAVDAEVERRLAALRGAARRRFVTELIEAAEARADSALTASEVARIHAVNDAYFAEIEDFSDADDPSERKQRLIRAHGTRNAALAEILGSATAARKATADAMGALE
jgi:Lon protease-like protein